MLGTAGALLGLSLAVGCWPGLGRWLQAAAARFGDFAGYGAAVLDGRPTGLARVVGEGVRVAAGSVAVGGATALAALGFAAWGLFRDGLPETWQRAVKRLSDPPLRSLQGLHGGNVCDYAAWLVAGMAALAALFAWALR